ncbi:GH25 family lysozyme [Listeria kieliensis]
MGKIVDISKYQAKVDYKKLKSEVDYVILRSSYGTQKFDEWLDTHLKGVIGAGIPFGLYHYALMEGGQDTINEANMLIKAVEKAKKIGKAPTYVFVDVEEKRCSDIVNETNRFISEVQNKTGIKCGLYSGDAFVKQHNLLKVNTPLRWTARYGQNDGKVNTKYQPTTQFHIWQYTSKGKLSSISGNLDLNTCSTAVLNQLTGSNAPTPTPKPKPATMKKPDRQYAEKGVFTARTTVAVKYKPLPTGEKQVAELTPGEKVHYNRVAFSKGYVWVQYRRSNGRDAWACAGKASADNSKNADKYGTFK